MPIADAVVVLSSGRSVAPGIEGISEWGDADRFFGGLALLDAGRAPYLVFTGGANPLAAEAPLEGDVLSAFAQRIGISPDAIRTTGPVTNTLEEAQAVAALMRGSPGVGAPPHVLLVTSAFHMPRASAVFERQGLRVTVFPVDFDRPASLRTDVLRFLPDAGARRALSLRMPFPWTRGVRGAPAAIVWSAPRPRSVAPHVSATNRPASIGHSLHRSHGGTNGMATDRPTARSWRARRRSRREGRGTHVPGRQQPASRPVVHPFRRAQPWLSVASGRRVDAVRSARRSRMMCVQHPCESANCP